MGVVEDKVRSKYPHGSVEFWVSHEVSMGRSLKAAAKALGVGETTLRDWIKAHNLRVVRTVWLVYGATGRRTTSLKEGSPSGQG